ncbi:MAG TPA: AMP-binding protein [Candidatus Cybelea sp.]|nr:AMP-binding protein [Candidatus Cybelea sp.]
MSTSSVERQGAVSPRLAAGGPMSGADTLRAAVDDTLPKLLVRNAEVRGKRPAMREKDHGIWQTWTWAQVLDGVREIAGGLSALGLARGDRVAIIGDNRPELYWAMMAAQCLGAVPVPVYQDSVADEMLFVLDHAGARFAVVEDQEQVDKLAGIKDRLVGLEHVIYKDARGLRHYGQAYLGSLAQLRAQGRDWNAAHPDVFLSEIAKGKGADVSVICYTSGTTGRPKGVMLSFDNLVRTAKLSIDFDRLGEREEVMAYLPMAWVGDHFLSYAQGLVAGFAVNCPESGETVMSDLREIGPTFLFAPPRIFETILTQVMIRMEDAGRVKRWLFRRFMDVARRSGIRILEGKSVSLLDRVLYRLGDLLIYGPLRNTLGFSRIRVAYTAGEAIGPDIFTFFRSLGVNLKQLYGQTESSVYCCLQTDADVRADTVGPPAPGVEMKITPEGEVMYRSPGVFVGYYRNVEATAETKTADGWVHTGDAGVFTDDGHLRVIDRAKDVGRLNDGTLFAPKYLENKLKFFPYIREAVAFGDGRDFAACFINIDLGAVGNWAERRGIAYTSYTDLAGRDEVYELIRGNIEQVNRDLSTDAALAGSQIRRFLILHKELDADDGELTRTRKVRRRTVAERYSNLIDALYSDRKSVAVEARVAYEDGRVGTMRAELKIADVPAFQHMRKAG